MANEGNETNEVNEMTNEVNEMTSEANEATEEVKTSSDSRLPLQLSRLPADKLLKVHQALQELKEAGLSEVPDLSSLAKVVKKKTDSSSNAKLPFEDLTSEYMKMSLWAWTPKRWFENIQGTGKPAGAKSEEETNNNGCEDQIPPDPADLQSRLDKMTARFLKQNDTKTREKDKIDVEKFAAWAEAMKASSAQVRSLATMDPGTKQAGDGVGVLFETTTAGGPRVLPKVNVGGMGEAGSFPTGGPIAKPLPAVISLHLGAEGCDVGLQSWQRFMAEHMLDSSGRPKDGEFYGSAVPLFAEGATGRYVPRAIFADYGSGKLDAIGGAGIFAPTSLFAGTKPGDSFEDGENDKEFGEQVFDGLRCQLEQADYAPGFLITQNSGEDMTLNGLSSMLLAKLSVECGKKSKHMLLGVPDPMLVGDDKMPYCKAGIFAPCTMEHLDMVSFYDRPALQRMASSKVNGLGLVGADDSACYSLLARMLSGLTGPLRFGSLVSASSGSRLPSSWSTYDTNACPYPRIHFFAPGLGGLVAQGMEDFLVPGQVGQEPGFGAAGAALRRGSLSGCVGKRDSSDKIMSAVMMCRGVEQSSVLSKLLEIKADRGFQFVDWCPTGFSIFSYKDPKSAAAEVTLLENTSAAAKVFESQGLGMDEHMAGQYTEARENLACIVKDYEEVSAETDYGGGEEEDYGDEF
mmetsp:Transcript_36143/g.83292  ORF Transcript_36143/g.83292 Transcript_36143/m.83292 type:complete len:688 (-) Transcript_36143:222-2285(-)